MTFDIETSERKLNQSKKQIEAEERKRRREDLKDIIDIVMHSPLRSGEVFKLSPENPVPISELKGKNVEVQTAIVLAMTNGAVKGDVKNADWLCKYAGYEPVKEAKVQVESVTFIDDVPEIAQAVAASLAVEDGDGKSE